MEHSMIQLGDMTMGRPNLGGQTEVVVYRLLQFSLRNILQQQYGDATCRELLKRAGVEAGYTYCRTFLDTTLEPFAFIAQLSQRLIEHGVGILKTEKTNLETLDFVFTVSEDLDCSGLPINGYTVCDYDEGFIQGILECYIGRPFIVQEVDCWVTGHKTCRFEVKQGVLSHANGT